MNENNVLRYAAAICMVAVAIAVSFGVIQWSMGGKETPHTPAPYYTPQLPYYQPTPNDKWIPNPYYVPQRPNGSNTGSKGAIE